MSTTLQALCRPSTPLLERLTRAGMAWVFLTLRGRSGGQSCRGTELQPGPAALPDGRTSGSTLWEGHQEAGGI